MCVCVCARMCAQSDVCLCVCVQLFVCACVQLSGRDVCVCAQSAVCVCVQLCVCVCVYACSVRFLATPRTAARQAPLSKNSGVGCHFLLQGVFPT